MPVGGQINKRMQKKQKKNSFVGRYGKRKKITERSN